jgi:hypothetical protein
MTLNFNLYNIRRKNLKRIYINNNINYNNNEDIIVKI